MFLTNVHFVKERSLVGYFGTGNLPGEVLNLGFEETLLVLEERQPLHHRGTREVCVGVSVFEGVATLAQGVCGHQKVLPIDPGALTVLHFGLDACLQSRVVLLLETQTSLMILALKGNKIHA